MKILLLGSGALKIGQAGEFDYSGSQAIKAAKLAGHEVILVNPNIATNQTSKMADKTYFLPVEPDFVERIIAKEKPNGIFLAWGGQTALNCGIELKNRGVLEKYEVKVLGTPVEAIEKTEDRALFNASLEEIGVKYPKSVACTDANEAVKALEKIGFPVIVRAAFTLGGGGSGFATNTEEFEKLIEKAFSFSPQILVEESLKGWKEVEYEVVRDAAGNKITVCNMENFDPLGIHTGESIVIAPSQTLNDHEYQKLRTIALKTIEHLGIVGECNIQYALDPHSDDYRVIEVNARLSRSSALASKATGYPLAFVAAQIALGKTLPEIKNAVTGKTSAMFEPSLDYVAVKIPRWDLNKFRKVSEKIGSEMKSVGEIMALGRSFEEAFQKGLRMLHIGAHGLTIHPFEFSDLQNQIQHPTPRRVFAIADFLTQGGSVEEVFEMTKIDHWFLAKMQNIVDIEREIAKNKGEKSPEFFRKIKKAGFSDAAIEKIWNGEYSETEIREMRKSSGILPVVKKIDTLAAEFPAETNYLYFTYHGEKNDISFENHSSQISFKQNQKPQTDEKLFLEKIQKVLPEEISEVEIHNSGWDSLVFEINKKWIFKFPRREEIRKTYEKEKTVLKKFREISPIPIPKIAFETEEFFGYEKIYGEELNLENLKNLDHKTRQKCAKQCANFLSKLHSTDFSEIPPSPHFDFEKFQTEVLPKIFPKISTTAQKNAKYFFQKFSENPKLLECKKTATHGDFAHGHIYMNGNEISGIIDFGDFQNDDPAYDFSGIFVDLGKDFCNEVLNFYNLKSEENFFDRVDFYQKRLPFEIAFHALKRGNSEDFYFGISKIEEIFGNNKTKRALVLGSGPYSIGSSVEFDWSCVNAIKALRAKNFATVMLNSNPETVSTDFEECDFLFFDEISLERVLDVIDLTQPEGTVIFAGGQIPNNLAPKLGEAKIPLLGTSAKNIDRAENRHKFSELCDALKIDQPEWKEFATLIEAEDFSEKVGYPVLIRPSKVLSGAAMAVAGDKDELEEFLGKAAKIDTDAPVVVSKFEVGAREIEIDAVAHNGELILHAISEHVENAGVHSGDATIVLPPQKTYLETIRRIKVIAKKLAAALEITGPFNMQFLAKDNFVKVIELNLRASRSFPFVSKITGINFLETAMNACLGEVLPLAARREKYKTLEMDHVGVKAPQFSFSRLSGADPVLSVEMASTGEVGCFGRSFEEAFLKAMISVGFQIPKKGILFCAGDLKSKLDLASVARFFIGQNFKIFATRGTADIFAENEIPCEVLDKISADENSKILQKIRSRDIDLVINIPKNFAHEEVTDGYQIRRAAIDANVPLVTNVQVAKAIAQSLREFPTRDSLPIEDEERYFSHE